MHLDYIAGMDEEFSRPVRAGQIKTQPQHFALAADTSTCAALAARFGLPAIAALAGDFTLRHERAGIIAAQLRMCAHITQICVVSLEPFETQIDEQSELRFVPARSLPEADEADLSPESLDGPDEIPYTNDLIDLGAALAEQLALALDPYPRRPGAALPADAQDDSAHPFAQLAAKFRPPE